MSARPACRPVRTSISSSTRTASRSIRLAAPSPSALPESAAAAGSDGSAVELLVNRIIRVESGGNARAKNPLSSRHRSRPVHQIDLAAHDEDLPAGSLQVDVGSRASLALRYDPTISREMVANLARENEARLRATRSQHHRRPALSRPLPWAGRRASGAVRAGQRLGRRGARRAGDQRQSVPDRQGLRLRDRLGRKEDDRQGAPRDGVWSERHDQDRRPHFARVHRAIARRC